MHIPHAHTLRYKTNTKKETYTNQSITQPYAAGEIKIVRASSLNQLPKDKKKRSG